MSRKHCKLKNGNCKLQIALVCTFAVIASSNAVAEPFSFNDIEFWVGEGSNRAAMVIDWVDDSQELPALVWGYRWDESATGADMIEAIVAEDDRLFARLGGSPGNAVAVYGLGYDANNDGQFGVDDGTLFDDETGIAFTGPADLGLATDAGDFYAEGWFIGFWHYGITSTNPYDGGSWNGRPPGMASRTLADGSWDSWTFTPMFDFTAFAENPEAAPAPGGLPGDYNQNGTVDAADYAVWRDAMAASLSTLANRHPNNSSLVGEDDFLYWRDHFGESMGSGATAYLAPGESPGANYSTVPEPAAWQLVMIAFWTLCITTFRTRKENDS
jgi:hypothetical protein